MVHDEGSVSARGTLTTFVGVYANKQRAPSNSRPCCKAAAITMSAKLATKQFGKSNRETSASSEKIQKWCPVEDDDERLSSLLSLSVITFLARLMLSSL
ncbi:hypothetical protein E4U14_000540 [Claviceps sp. LM454 group G7]|nr:hypothetical protein E4U14_000540 [Claviceps sp. LM454 group G7]